ncbi:MAG: DUF148 domain-containing protein [Verrucomicrobia bacterium]|nr:MAG: DUF148 domain-containing protein [Verrucomicrobiota bacterium]
MKAIEKMTRTLGLVAGACLALGFVARAQDTNSTSTTSTTPPEHKGHGHRHGQGQGAGGGEFVEQHRAEMEKMREKLKDMTPEQRQEAMKKFHEKLGDKMKERIEQNPNLTADQKKEILDHMRQLREKAQAAREKITSDTSLSEAQKHEAMKKLRETMEADFKALREKHQGAFGPKPGPPQGQQGGTPPSV